MSQLSAAIAKPTLGFNVRLVRAVEKHPLIYNYQFEGYTNRQLKHDAWKKIALELGSSVIKCKEKWRNLRICYTEYIRKYSTDTPQQLHTRSYLTEVMKFLRPFIRTREDSFRAPTVEADTSFHQVFSNMISPKIENDDSEIISDDDEISNAELVAVKCSENILKEELDISTLDEIQNPNDSATLLLPDLISNKQTHSEFLNNGNLVLLNSNPRHQFLMSIVPDLEKMTDRQMRKFRSKVSTAIEEILEDE